MRRPPQELGAVLGSLQERLAPPDLLAAVQRHWREAAGEEIAAEAEPGSERDGRVTFRCSSAVWAAELTMLEQGLLAELNRRLPRERQARGLKFTAAPPRGRSTDRQP
jgi:predicted nucleic acid-binding Zn ribbon protein